MKENTLWINVDSQTQQLHLYDGDELLKHYIASTARNGLGEINGSECTPRGWHQIRAKIGQGYAADTVFVERRPTGEIYTDELAKQYPKRGWVLTRIMWLSGLEVGKNRLGHVDTMRRYVYIHGAPDSKMAKRPSSHGCVCLYNKDVIDLFDRVPVGTKVYIQ